MLFLEVLIAEVLPVPIATVAVEEILAGEAQTSNLPKVLNLNYLKGLPPNAVYVDRRSKWGNPFILENECDRDFVCDEYEKYLLGNVVLLSQLEELRGKDLVCWCHPKRCHGHTLLRLANLPRYNMFLD